MESDCQPKLLFHYLFFFCRSTTNSQASTHSSSGGFVHFLDYNLDYNQLTEVIEGTYSKIWWPSAHQYVCKVLSDAPCSSLGVYTALKGASSSYPSSTAAKFQCKHFSAQPQRPQKPHTHTHTHPTATASRRWLHFVPSRGDRPLNGFIGTVQTVRGILSLSFNFWVYSAGVSGCGVGEGGGGGWWWYRGAPPPPQSHFTLQTLLSAPVR